MCLETGLVFFRFVPHSAVDLAAEKNEKNKEKLRNAALISSSTTTLTPMHQQGVSDQTLQILNAQALVIQRHCVDGLMGLMRQLGYAYSELSRFSCRKAIEILEDVPAKHRQAAWVLGHLGKAHFELSKYKDAKRYEKLVSIM